MKIATVAEVEAQFSAFVKSSKEGPVVVTRSGKPVAVLVGVEGEDELECSLMAHSPGLREILDGSFPIVVPRLWQRDVCDAGRLWLAW